jgi:hypothetical protein
LKRRFALDDEYLEDLKAEIIHAKKLAVDEQEQCCGGSVALRKPLQGFKLTRLFMQASHPRANGTT